MLKILNFRTLADNVTNRVGKKIKPNTIFRSGVLTYATKIDIRKIKSLGIKDVFDFRNDAELLMLPAHKNDHFTTHSFDILEELANADAKAYLDKTKEELHKGIIKLYSEDFLITDKYKKVVASIIEQDNPEFLFHCTAGKDRTGIFGAIIMMILDFDMDAIKNEYLILSKRSIRIMCAEMLKKTGVKRADVDVKKFVGILGVFPEFIDAYLNAILSKYQSIDDYLKDKVGVTSEVKAVFQKIYLI